MSYIVKNCPCYIDMPLYNHDKVCRLGDIVKPNHKELYVYCKDCTDCVMKQIVERCKDSMDYHSKDMYILGKTNMAGIVLALLQIEEVENDR